MSRASSLPGGNPAHSSPGAKFSRFWRTIRSSASCSVSRSLMGSAHSMLMSFTAARGMTLNAQRPTNCSAFSIRMAFSELGPLGVLITASVPGGIPIDPTGITGLALLAAAREGAGVALQPAFAAAPPIAAGQLGRARARAARQR